MPNSSSDTSTADALQNPTGDRMTGHIAAIYNTRVAKRAFGWVWSNTDAITKWLQVIALLFAACWTFLIFKDTQAPALETPPAVSIGLNGYLLEQSICQINAEVEINNIGLKSVEVANVHVRMWIEDLKLSTGLNYIDVNALENGTPTFDERPTTALNTRFPPRTDLHVGFLWIFSGPPNASWYLVRADAEDSKGHILGQADFLKYGLCPKG